MPQSLAKVHIHLVFSTKNRVNFLSDAKVRESMHKYLAGILRGLDSPPTEIGGTADHIHALFLQSRTQTIAKLVGELKRSSSLWVKDTFSALDSFQWQNGYGAFSVSHSNVGEVARYVRDQEKHHATISFQEEFRLLLQKHEVEYDERYVWD